MTPPANPETRQIHQPAVLVVPGYNVPGVFSAGEDDLVTQGDAAGIPINNDNDVLTVGNL